MRKLSCEEALPLLAAFQDNELDGVTSLAVQEHIDECLLCGRQLWWNAEADASLRRLAEATPPAPSALRARVLRTAAGERRVTSMSFRRRMLAVAAAIVVLLGIATAYFHSAAAPDVMQFVENHTDSLQQADPVEFQTANPSEAERWLRARLPFAPAVPRPRGYRLLGARVCEVNNAPVAFLLYEHESKRLSCFVSAYTQTTLRGFDTTAARRIHLGTCEGKNVAAWDADRSGYLLVGDVPRESLLAFARNATNPAP